MNVLSFHETDVLMSLFKRIFRCPFGHNAHKQNAVLKLSLSRNKRERLQQMHDAFTTFYADLKLSVLEVTVPVELLGDYATLEELRLKILTYYCELSATEIDIRLWPLLPYHDSKIDTQEKQGFLSEIHPLLKQTAEKLIRSADTFMLTSTDSFAARLEEIFLEEFSKKTPHPTIRMNEWLDIRWCGVTLWCESNDTIRKFYPETNRNLFSFVTCPLYPKEFGRYSSQAKIVYTRKSELFKLIRDCADDVNRIRISNNLVLQEAGVLIEDLRKDYQGGGIWIPEYK